MESALSPRHPEHGAAGAGYFAERKMKKALLAFALLAGCGSPDQAGGNDTVAEPARTDSAASAGLTGLYEGGRPDQPDQLCMIDDGDGPAAFGLVVWGADLHSCLGAG